MNIYTIAVPGQSPVDVQGISIRTENVTITTPPTIPNTFILWGLVAGSSTYAKVAESYSFAQPTINTFFWGSNPTRYQIGMRVLLYGSTGQLQWVNAGGGVNNGSLIVVDWYLTPGNTTVNRCDAIVTVDTLGNEIRINGVNGQPCPTWITRPANDCGDTEIRCEDLSDPRGFCCIPCDSLNSKIRALI